MAVLKNAGSTLLGSVLTILIALDLLSGIVGGIWLAVAGKWSMIWSGLLAGLFMPFVYSIAALPGFGIGWLIVKVHEKRLVLPGLVLGFCGGLYNNGFLAAWSYCIFWTFVPAPADVSIFARLLWGYATVIGPIDYMANKEKQLSIGQEWKASPGHILVFTRACFFTLEPSYMPRTYRVKDRSNLFVASRYYGRFVIRSYLPRLFGTR